MRTKRFCFTILLGTSTAFLGTMLFPAATWAAGDSLPTVAAQGSIAEVRRLLDAGAPIDAKQERSGWTALIAAIRAGKTDVATLLLERGANPNAAGLTGYTPLMAATQQGNVALLRILLLRGANPNQATPKGLTPLMLAAGHPGGTQTEKNDLECVKILLRGGADPEKKHTTGATALTVAEARHATQIAAYLRRVVGGGTAATVPTVGDGIITGSVAYRERIAMSSAAFAVVRLLDAAPKSPVVLSQTVTPFLGKQVPVAFSLKYETVSLSARPNGRFVLDARIIAGGTAQFRTPQPVPTLTAGAPSKKVLLLVTPTNEVSRTALASEAITNTDKVLDQAGSSFRGQLTIGETQTKYTAWFLAGKLVRINTSSSPEDYGSRSDQLYFAEDTTNERIPLLRASYLTAKRIVHAGAASVPSGYEQVIQKIILDDAGKPLVTIKTVDKQKQDVTALDITAARNFARIVAAEVVRVAGKNRKR